jgi:hypothetical protein
MRGCGLLHGKTWTSAAAADGTIKTGVLNSLEHTATSSVRAGLRSFRCARAQTLDISLVEFELMPECEFRPSQTFR